MMASIMHIKSMGKIQIALVVLMSLMLVGCNASVGVGVSVGVPVGKHGQVNIGASRWR
jgi:predicted small secreted protein